jgi:hypothetical protein
MVSSEKQGRTPKKGRGITPWRPNQHGAWPMIVIPVIAGLFWGITLWDIIPAGSRGSGLHGSGGMWLTYLTVAVAWIVGYHAFFAGGLWLTGRRSGNARVTGEARRPTLVYGAVTLVAVIVSVLLQPHLLWWAVVFVPLTVIAVAEVNRGTPRSLIAGIAETVASAFILPVFATVGIGSSEPVGSGVTLTRNLFSSDVISAVPAAVWAAAGWLALYQVGTVLYVKTMIRKRGEPAWVTASVVYHAVALVIVLVSVKTDRLAVLPWLLAVIVFAWCLWRAWAVPRDAASGASGTTWTPKKVGMTEIPVTVGVALACSAVAWLYDGPLVLWVG